MTTRLLGWDYEESLAGNDTSMYYEFAVGAGGVEDLSVMLNWNVQVTDQNADPNIFDPAWILADLSLTLWDSTNGFLDTQVDISNSAVDNVEHIFASLLSEGIYTLQVTNHSSLGSSFAMSWRMTAIPEPGSGGVLLFFSLTLLLRRRRH